MAYSGYINMTLSNTQLPKYAILCRDVECMEVEHQTALFSKYNDRVLALNVASNPLYKYNQNRHLFQPGWNKYLADYHTEV